MNINLIHGFCLFCFVEYRPLNTECPHHEMRRVANELFELHLINAMRIVAQEVANRLVEEWMARRRANEPDVVEFEVVNENKLFWDQQKSILRKKEGEMFLSRFFKQTFSFLVKKFYREKKIKNNEY